MNRHFAERFLDFVTPAEAGVQKLSEELDPAFAGMTTVHWMYMFFDDLLTKSEKVFFIG